MGQKSLKERVQSGEIIPSRSTHRPESFEEAFKMMVCRLFVEFDLKNSPPLTRDKIAEAIGVSEIQMRQILAYRIELFDISFLIEKLDCLKDSMLAENIDMLEEVKRLIPSK
jgi:hypothetical protein